MVFVIRLFTSEKFVKKGHFDWIFFRRTDVTMKIIRCMPGIETSLF